jgi:hypothetical protein
MALISTWWSTNWVNVRVQHDFSSADSSTQRLSEGTSTPGWYQTQLTDVYKLRQLDAAGENKQNGKNSGHFYLVNAGATDYRDILYIYVSPRMTPDPYSSTGYYPAPDNDNFYVYPPASDPTGTYDSNVRLYYFRPATGGTWYDLHHFQPYTYYGNPAEVIAAILLHLGADDDFIDTDAFSDADDGLAAMTTEPQVLVTREAGETVAETIKRIVRHSNDILCVNMEGKLALISRTSPPAGPTSLTVSDVIGKVTWRYAREYISNKAVTSFGEWVYRYGDRTNYPGGSGWSFSATFDRQADWDTTGILSSTEEDTTSQAKYGEKVLSNISKEMETRDENGRIIDGELVTRPAYHFPYFFDEDCRDAVMERLTDVESTLRREIEITQDLRGMDFDIGYEVTGIEVTGDGDTITATCIEKEIDFQNLTVKSKLLEEPS